MLLSNPSRQLPRCSSSLAPRPSTNASALSTASLSTAPLGTAPLGTAPLEPSSSAPQLRHAQIGQMAISDDEEHQEYLAAVAAAGVPFNGRPFGPLGSRQQPGRRPNMDAAAPDIDARPPTRDCISRESIAAGVAAWLPSPCCNHLHATQQTHHARKEEKQLHLSTPGASAPPLSPSVPLVPVTVPLYEPLPPPPAHSLEAALYVDATSLGRRRTPLPLSASAPSLNRTRPPSLAHFCAPSRLATTPATTSAIALGAGLGGAAAGAAGAGPPSGVATGALPPPRPIRGSQLRRFESRGELYAPPAPVWPALASATSPAEIRTAVASLLLADVSAPGWGTNHGTAESADGAAAGHVGGWGGGGGRPPSRGSRDGELDDPEIDPEIAAEVAWDAPSARSSRPPSDLNSKPSTPSTLPPTLHAAKGAHYGASQLSGGGGVHKALGVNKAPTPKNKPHTPSGRTPSPSQLAASAAAAMAEESRMRAVASLEIMQERARPTDFPGRRVEASRARLRLETRIAAAAARRGR